MPSFQTISTAPSEHALAVRSMFGRIAGRYDLLNRVLSARRDVAWRRHALGLWRGQPAEVLDLACGTFDLAREALDQGKAKRVHGCDFCQPMLVAGAAKRSGRPVTASVGDALRLPYAEGAFDGAMAAYGWRNFKTDRLSMCSPPDTAALSLFLMSRLKPFASQWVLWGLISSIACVIKQQRPLAIQPCRTIPLP